ncbi:pathogenesis-related thaumatin-like protein 3.5 [Oryza brachyantha]|uniref:pathogenesis-related thaumatin-like protein 3.5 n=1 Tax=Oryza brachyantha TaxID=4533 RepID=UPI001ADA4A8B|nr:pathogenesis-related thaumatin-like protein 3.5 [Oryza brachyantha]
MAMRRQSWTFEVAFIVLAGFATRGFSKSFTITNNCDYTVWPGVLSSAGSVAPESNGFELAPGQSRTMSAPAGWSGRLWGRTLCASDTSGKLACVTGDCGSGRTDCGGGGAAPPATLAEFTLDGSGGMDFYDVSLVDGYNLPVLVTPEGAAAGGNCNPTGCVADLNAACPAELRVASPAAAAAGGGGVACKSACEAFGSAQYCCSGEYGNPNTCRPSSYSQFFKSACPRAYSYAYDDATSTFTCAGTATTYTITFCPSTSSVKAAGPNPLINGTTVNAGGNESAAAAPRPPSRLVLVCVAVFALARAFL